MRSAWLVAALAVLASLAACGVMSGAQESPALESIRDASSEDAEPDSRPSAEASLDASSEASLPPPPACGGLTLDGTPLVDGRVVTTSAPPPNGVGPIPDGLYHLVDLIIYRGEDGGTEPTSTGNHGATLVSGGGRYVLSMNNVTAPRIDGSSVTYSPPYLSATFYCPVASAAIKYGYSLSGNRVTRYVTLVGNRVMASVEERVSD